MARQFKGLSDYQHGMSPKIGIVLVNLGTPEAPTASALRTYLAEFLSDPRVVEMSKWLWKIILHGIILRTRPAKSAQAYQKVWTEQGSPLYFESKKLQQQIENIAKEQGNTNLQWSLAMRYGQPSIAQQMQKMQQEGVEKFIVIPLYPQYSGATSGSVADAVFAELSQWRWVPELHIMGSYHDDPAYIQLIAESITNKGFNPEQEKLLISFHGMPKDTLDKGDPYYCHCHKSAGLIAEQLELNESQWEMVFQSRFGKAEWLKPYVVERLDQLVQEGNKKIRMICPGFAVDCLETLEEIQLAGEEQFLASGGESFHFIPCLNSSTQHAQFHWQRIEPLVNILGNTMDNQRVKFKVP